MKKLSTLKIDEMYDLSSFRATHQDEITEITQMLKKRGRELWIQTSLADELRTQQSGDEVTFVVNQNINFTQHCIGSCRFCSYIIKPEIVKDKPTRV